jgi:hypothetical protein
MLAAQPAPAGQAHGTVSAASQHKTTPSSQQKQKPSAKRHRTIAHRHTASTPTKAAPAAAAVSAASSAAPPAPNWPVKEQPQPAKVVWDSRGLEIQALNSSLDLILHEVATDIGAKIQGLSQDERVFGTYGPGPAREVLSELLDGTGLNILMIGDQGGGAPREIVLSTSSPAGAQPAGTPRPPLQSEDEEAPEPPPNYPPQPPRPIPIRNPFGNGTPQIPPEVLQQQMQQRQEQLQQQQEQQQSNQQQ